MEFKDQLRLARTLRGLSQTELARRVGVAPQAIWNYEAGKREPARRDLLRLADALEIDAWVFLDLPRWDQVQRIVDDLEEAKANALRVAERIMRPSAGNTSPDGADNPDAGAAYAGDDGPPAQIHTCYPPESTPERTLVGAA